MKRVRLQKDKQENSRLQEKKTKQNKNKTVWCIAVQIALARLKHIRYGAKTNKTNLEV